MLSDWETKQHIKLLQDVAQKVWGNSCEIGEMTEVDSIYPAFELPLILYGKYYVKLEYETSTMITTICLNHKYVELGDLTGISLPYGFKSMYPDNLEHNFRLLDKVIREMEK